MTSLALVFPPVLNPEEGNLPPIGILSLAAVLREAKHSVEIIDLALLTREGILDPRRNLYQESASIIADYCPEVVGFSTQSVTLPGVLSIASLLKQTSPQIFVVLGGPGIDKIGERILQDFPAIDLIIRGEGETSILALANNFRKPANERGVQGGIWREGGRIIYGEPPKLISHLGSLPSPAVDLGSAPKRYSLANGNNRVEMPIEFARGCCFRCHFCGCSSFWDYRIRRFPIQRVVEQINRLHTELNVEHFYIIHDNLTINRRIAVDLALAIRELGLPITWDARCRLDLVDPELLAIFRDAGCIEILYGVESADQGMLDTMGKKLSVETQMPSILATIRAGILPILSFVVGHPTETRTSLETTLSFILKLCASGSDLAVHIHVLSVVPGTPMHTELIDRLYLKFSTSFGRAVSYAEVGVLPEDLKIIEKSPEMFSSFYSIGSENLEDHTIQVAARLFPELASKFSASIVLACSERTFSIVELTEAWGRYLDSHHIPWKDLLRFDIANITIDHFHHFFCTSRFVAPNPLSGSDVFEDLCAMTEFESALARAVWQDFDIRSVMSRFGRTTVEKYKGLRIANALT